MAACSRRRTSRASAAPSSRGALPGPGRRRWCSPRWTVASGPLAAWRYRRDERAGAGLTRGRHGRGDLDGRATAAGGGSRSPFVAATLFFTIAPLLSLLANPPAPAAFVLLLVGWAVFAAVLALPAPVGRRSPRPVRPLLAVAVGGDGRRSRVVVAGRVRGDRGRGALLLRGRDGGAARAASAGRSAAIAARGRWPPLRDTRRRPATGPPAVTIGVTVGDDLPDAVRPGRARPVQPRAAGRAPELAELAVAEERSRIARDLHDTLGHSLSVIALKSELARRVLPDDPARAAAEIGDVERVAREALASVRETVERLPPADARDRARRGAGRARGGRASRATSSPRPRACRADVDAVLGWAVREGVTNVLRHSDAARARDPRRRRRGAGAVEVDGRRARARRAAGGRRSRGRDRPRRACASGAAASAGSVEAGPLPGRRLPAAGSRVPVAAGRGAAA